jgi:hypothetical protein
MEPEIEREFNEKIKYEKEFKELLTEREIERDVPVKLLGSITTNNLKNITNLIGYSEPISTRWSAQRGYKFTGREETLANEVKEECVDKFCAFIIQGKGKKEKVITDYTVDERATTPVEKKYIPMCILNVLGQFESIEGAKERLLEDQCNIPFIVEAKKIYKPEPKTKDVEYDAVVIFTAKEW